MGNFFVKIYDYFIAHKAILYIIMVITTILMLAASLQVEYAEDITNFFPKQQNDIANIFKSMKAKDKLVVMFTNKDDNNNPYLLIDCAEQFRSRIEDDSRFTDNAKFTLGVNDSIIEQTSNFIYNSLPVFLDDDDFARLDSITKDDALRCVIKNNYNNLLSPIGGYISEYIYKDPINIGTPLLKALSNQGNNIEYSLVDNYIMSADENTLIAYIDPVAGFSGSDNETLIDIIESTIKDINQLYPDVITEYFGAPAVAAYNARQIKKDTLITLNIAILIVVIFITLSFRNKYTILLIIMPVVYGALFALSLIWVINGEISLISVGSGSVIFGIALSYSIHILSHTNHSSDMRQLIRELAYPLTVGSFTTIGAFAGLIFTNSKLLQDFGLFSSLTLIGTTIFALVFLPHMTGINDKTITISKPLRFVNRISSLRPDYSKSIIITLLVMTIVCGLFYNNVGFNSNMMDLNYEPTHLKNAELRLNGFIKAGQGESNVMFLASSHTAEEASQGYNNMCAILDSIKEIGLIKSYSSIARFIVPDSVQIQRIDRWNKFWTNDKIAHIKSVIDSESILYNFEESAFGDFYDIIEADYKSVSYTQNGQAANLFPDWISPGNSMTSFIAQVRLDNQNKQTIYDILSDTDGVIALDRAFFAGKMVEDVSHNFYLILYISGFLIFFALLISYGRIELTLISFLPMFISWILILGIMSFLGIQFNIVTIILSTFIFGIGDDFSIFIMDGLQGEYKDRNPVLNHHKTAIFYSAFTIVAGMGALVFAKHPAMHSLGLISLIGILVVVFVSYTIQPFIYRLLISSNTNKGLFPYTLVSLLNSVYAFGLFLFGCLIIKLCIIALYLFPIKSQKRKDLIHGITRCFMSRFVKMMLFNKMININESEESFENPAVIIANHQSFIDIIMLLSLNKKFVMVTNGWVWRSPFFGRIVRYLDFYHTENGYEELVESLKPKIAQGYSVIVFPEGTRSEDCRIKRFHRGAFYLAEHLNIDIIPILIYGNGLVSSKRQPFYIKSGLVISKILPRITPCNESFGIGYRERSKKIAKYFRNEYSDLYEQFNRTSNPYFREMLIKNYIYKGPVLEWYMRIKLSMEKWYDRYDRMLPREGFIVDLGCGYGAMSYMLSMLSNRRRIIGIDYDEDKIQTANNCFSKNENIDFIHGDIREVEFPPADAFVISDVLHYLDSDSQEKVIERCIASLNKNGMIVVRDGDASDKEKHGNTEMTEKWSTRIVKFNKTDGPLCFLSHQQLEVIAKKNNMNLDVIESGSINSNTLFVLTGNQI